MFWCPFSQRAVWPGNLTAFKQDCAVAAGSSRVEPLPAEYSLLWLSARCRKSLLDTKCQAKQCLCVSLELSGSNRWVMFVQHQKEKKQNHLTSACSLVYWFGLMALTLSNGHLSWVPGRLLCVCFLCLEQCEEGCYQDQPPCGHDMDTYDSTLRPKLLYRAAFSGCLHSLFSQVDALWFTSVSPSRIVHKAFLRDG